MISEFEGFQSSMNDPTKLGRASKWSHSNRPNLKIAEHGDCGINHVDLVFSFTLNVLIVSAMAEAAGYFSAEEWRDLRGVMLSRRLTTETKPKMSASSQIYSLIEKGF